jgi:PAS domain S-box-containing protein
MMRWPRSLRAQFAIALGAMSLLVLLGGAVAVNGLLRLGEQARQAAQDRLSYLNDAQSLLDHTRQIQLYAAQAAQQPDAVAEAARPADATAPAATQAESAAANAAAYAAVLEHLDELDRLTARLAASDDASVLDLYQSGQLFRSAFEVVAQLRAVSRNASDAAAVKASIDRSLAEMQIYAAAMVSAAQQQSQVFARAYQASVDRLADVSRQSALWVAGLIVGSLGAAWLIGHYFLGQHVLGRVRVVSTYLRDRGCSDAAGDGHDGADARVPVSGEDEVAEMARAVERSIGDRQQLAAARLRLQESGRRLEALLEHIADAIVVIQGDAVVQVNRAALDLFACDEPALLRRPAHTLLAEGALRPAGQNEPRDARDATLLRGDGSTLPVGVSVSDVPTSEGVLTTLVLRDATLRKKAEKHLIEARDAAEAARAAQAALLASMSHELRTPLNGILGYAQLLSLSPTLADAQRQQVGIIDSCGQHLLALINDVLDLAKHEAGKVELSRDVVALPRLAAQVHDILRVKAEEAGLQLDCEAGEQLPTQVLADERRLKQVLLNLGANAVKFTERGGVALRIALLALEHGGNALVRFEVADTGLGLTARQLETLFRPFEQFGDPRRRSAGTGLGLAISQQLVKLMGSEIRVRSAPGLGTTFWFDLRLPLADASLLRTPALPAPVAGYRGPRRSVMLVHHDPADRALLRDTLQPLGFSVREAASTAQALAQLDAAPFDAVIADCIATRDCRSLVDELRSAAAAKALPVIAISASAERSPSRQAAPDPLLAVLPKPFERELLLAELGRVLQLEWTAGEPRQGTAALLRGG